MVRILLYTYIHYIYDKRIPLRIPTKKSIQNYVYNIHKIYDLKLGNIRSNKFAYHERTINFLLNKKQNAFYPYPEDNMHINNGIIFILEKSSKFVNIMYIS